MNEEDLKKLYQMRRKDRLRAKGRRRRRLETLPNSLNDLLSNYFGKDTHALKKLEESRALEAWSRMVGGPAAQVSKAVRIRNNKLIVYVKDPLWAQQLVFLKRQILMKYRQHFPKLGLRDIFITRGVT